jgi:hypothetical protein
MLFLHASLLAGTALVALPIVLHLMMRRRPRHLEFPALRFVRQRHQANRRQVRLRHLLLLLLRAAAIALLAFALARPSIRFSGALGSQEAPVAAAMVFDASPRMGYRHENQTRLQVAQQFGGRLLAQLPRESQVAVLDTRLGPAAFQVDRGAALAQIDRLEVVANSQPLSRVIDDALRLVGQSELERKELYVFTDLSEAAWPAEAASRIKARLDELPGAAVYLVDVGIEHPVNFALGELRLSSQVLSTRGDLDVETTLRHTGGAEERSVQLYMLDSARRPQKRNEQVVKLTPSAASEVRLKVGALEPGTHQGFVRIGGEDALPADDVRYFTVEVTRPWRILVAAPKPAQQYALFFVEAITPSDIRKQGRARFDCEIVDVRELKTKDLAPFAAVCVLDPTPLEPEVWRKLAGYAADGHGVAVFLGRNARPLDSFNQTDAQTVLAGKLTVQARRPEGDLHLAPRDYQHPVLKPLARWAGSVPWGAFPVFRYWDLDLAAGVQPIINFSDRRPALVERPLGSGRAVTMTTPISDRPSEDPWNLLPSGEAWPFLAVTNQLMTYLVGAGDEQFNYYAGQSAVLRLDPLAKYSTYVVSTPQDLKLPLPVDQQRHVLVFTATDQVGNYRVQAGGEATGVDRGFSVNLSSEQSRLDRLPQERLRDFFGERAFRLVRDQKQLDREVTSGRVGRELFPVLILLVAMVLGLEQLTANRFYKDEG